jgi:hypothetical protein
MAVGKGRTASHPHYHLRYQIIPGPRVEANARDLARFCRRHGVEEVVLFFAGEEWNSGLLSRAEEDRWFDTVRRARRVLDHAGIVVSLNPWMTVLHCDRGRRLPADRRFAAMVSPTGETSQAVASFADPAWQRYIFRLYGRFAKLGFRVIWVEDDFRYHNHGPLTWGGGFEEAVLRRFAAKLGRTVTRASVVRNILKPGRPHPWRALWFATWREIQLEVARGLADAVAANSPACTRLGLMSSGLPVHSAEGRDWQALFAALTIDGEVAHRPHYAAYQEWPGRNAAYSIMMLEQQKALRPPGCEVAPEVENFPFTRWSKSDCQTWSEMALCMLHGADALLLNLFPFSGNSVTQEPAIGELLDRSRPALQWIAGRCGASSGSWGVGTPFPQAAAECVRTAQGKAMPELYASVLDAGHFLMPYGIPVTGRTQPVNAIFGNMAWAFGDADVRDMLRGGLLLDGTAAHILCGRGFGGELGVDAEALVGREEGVFAVETVTGVAPGVAAGLHFNFNSLPQTARIRPRKGAAEWTTIVTPLGKRFGAGMVAFRNRLGGRVVTLAACDPAVLARSDQRQALVREAIAWLWGGLPPHACVSGAPHALPMHIRAGKRDVLAILNGGTDPARPVVHVPAADWRRATGYVLAPLRKPVRVRLVAARRGKRLTLTPAGEVPYMGFLVVER